MLCCIAFGAWLSSCKKQFAAWLHGYEKNLRFWRARLAWCKKVHCTPFGFRKYQAHLLVQVTAQVTKQQLNATRLDKCRYPIIAILHVPSLSHGSLALGYEPGWVDTETNHALSVRRCVTQSPVARSASCMALLPDLNPAARQVGIRVHETRMQGAGSSAREVSCSSCVQGTSASG